MIADGVGACALACWEVFYRSLSKRAASVACEDDANEVPPEVAFLGLERRAVLVGRPDPRYALPGALLEYASIWTYDWSRVIILSDAGDVADDLPSTDMFSAETMRVTVYFERILTHLQPERWCEVTRNLCEIGIDRPVKKPGRLVEVYEHSHTAFNLMPRAALAACVGRLLSLTSSYTFWLCHRMQLKETQFLSNEDPCILAGLILGQPMILLITWKVKCAAVAEAWVTTLHFILLCRNLGHPRWPVLTQVVCEAVPRALHLAIHWLRHRELQHKVAEFLTKGCVADEEIRVVVKRDEVRIQQWSVLLTAIYEYDPDLVNTMGSLLDLLEQDCVEETPAVVDIDAGAACSWCNRSEKLYYLRDPSSLKKFRVCVECLRKNLTQDDPPRLRTGRLQGGLGSAPTRDVVDYSTPD